MNPARPLVRRAGGVAVAVLLGTLATLALATPASAHYSTVSGVARCDTDSGTYQVTWTVKNSESNPETLYAATLTPSGTTASPIATNATVPGNYGSLVGVQGVAGSATLATLSVRGHWDFDGFTEKNYVKGSVTLDGRCLPNQAGPHASAQSACDGTVLVTVTNDAKATGSTTFTIKATNANAATRAVGPGGSATVTVPAASAGAITIFAGRTMVGTFSWAKPANCAPVIVSSKSDCAALTVSLENPAGNGPVSATVATSEESTEVTVGGGETKTVTFTAKAGTSATVTFGAGAAAAARIAQAVAADAVAPITVAWANPGAICAPPSSLPNTGQKIGATIAAGVALVGLGIGLLLYLRHRRRTGQTAR